MYAALLVAGLVLNSLAAAEKNPKHVASTYTSVGHGATNTIRNNVASHHNITYIDKTENMLRTPNVNKYYDEHKKKKKPKKSPKRTVQKIIKNNRAKMRKVYFTKRAKPTPPTPKVDYDKKYGKDDKQWREEQSTTQATQRKKANRKYSPKLSGYHIPFHKMQKKDKRHKRGLSRELYILKDLDEIEFLSKEGDEDVVKAHVKSFW